MIQKIQKNKNLWSRAIPHVHIEVCKITMMIWKKQTLRRRKMNFNRLKMIDK
jgi:hypothetical protein